MLPSMPILFTRESQDAFGNKIEPSTSFFSHNTFKEPAINLEPPPPVVPDLPKAPTKESKGKGNAKKKESTKEAPPKISNSALETALVKSYYKKVQSRFSAHSNLPTNKFVQFQNILKSFDPTKQSPVDLYRKVEDIFGEENKDIVEEFLLFMKPDQALQVGRFMDHFLMTQMTDFIEMLQVTLSRKPTVLRKVLRAITAAINSGNSVEMRSRVLPHLRAHPRLATMFKTLFPDERPPDSAYETGTDVINESFLTTDTGYDVWEFQEASDNMKKVEAKEGLDTMYLHGRVFLQHGRMLRPARVTFPYSKEPYRVHARRLAPNHAHLSPPHSGDETASPKRHARTNSKIPPKRTKKQIKSPTKKDVNDNTNKDPNLTNSPKNVRKPKNKQGKKDESKKDKKENLKLCKNHVVSKKDEKAKFKVEVKVDIKKSDLESKKTVVEIRKSDIENKKPDVESKKPDVEVQTEAKKLDKVEVKLEVKKSESESKRNWTREEDKTMLQVLKGEAGSEQIFGKIRDLLPHRSVAEIKERFCHVMNLLQKMAVGEVT